MELTMLVQRRIWNPELNVTTRTVQNILNQSVDGN